MTDTKHTPRLMTQITEGMDVYDRTDNKIGTVDAIQFGEEDLARPGAETATAPDRRPYDETLIEDIARAFDSSQQMPEEVRKRLLRFGFMKVDAGFLRSDRFVEAGHVASVSDDAVRLKVTDDELIKS